MFTDVYRSGDVLAGRYQVASIIGKGGMSTVYLADDLKLNGRRWAVKVTSEHAFNHAGFMREAELLSQLDHPFFPKLADILEPDERGLSCIVMEFISGETLQAKLERAGRLPWNEAVRYAEQLCSLFDYLHSRTPPVIYRDLKPSNVMIDSSNHIRLIDFGIARHHVSDRSADTVRLGTVGFAAPEQFRGGQTDARTDLYTLGAMLYFLISGGHYYEPEDHSTDTRLSGVPDDVCAVLERLLAASPDLRYSDARVAGLALRALLESVPSAAQIRRGTGWGLEARQLIIVGGMYRGCGSSFTTLALSEALRGRGVPHTVVEGGCCEPTFAARLQAGGRLPDKLVDWTLDGDEEEAGFQTEYCEWLLLDPTIGQRTWQAERTFRQLSRLAAQVTLVDISTGWSDPVAAKLIAMADHIVCVTGPSYIQLSQPDVQVRFEHVIEWRRSVRSVHLVLNRDTPFRGHHTFMQSLPVLPVLTLPNVQLEDMLTSEWSGRWLPETHPVWRGMLAELNAFLDRIIPGMTRGHGSTRRHWWTGRRHTP